MQPIFFIYAKQLEPAQLAHFQSRSADSARLVAQTEYLDFHLAFFEILQKNVDFRPLAAEIQCDFSELAIIPTLDEAGLLVMDMDSTAIKIECIDEIAKLAGTGEEVSAITAAAMRGELDFEQSLRKRVGTLKGAQESILQTVRENLPLMEGFEPMVCVLQAQGWKIAIASGGFTYFADYLKETYQLDAAVSNQFEIIDGTLTGNVLGRVVDAQFKAETLQTLAAQFNIPRHQWVAIGDGANDLPMLKTASLGAAFHAKPKVQEQAQVVVNFADLSALLLLLNAQAIFNSLK